MIAKTIQDIINESGYPLQIKLESFINNNSDQHKWRVFTKEHRWENRDTHEEGFIDLILVHRSLPVRLVIECKRISGKWIFLIPESQKKSESNFRVFVSNFESRNFSWADLDIIPNTYESAFCVLESGDKKDSRTLEKISGELLLSLENLAYEEVNIFQNNIDQQNQGTTPIRARLFYFPIIVTTADLQICVFDPEKINLSDGKINKSDIEQVKFIRFRKNLATSFRTKKTNAVDIRKSNAENDRTIFVVKAEEILKFLIDMGSEMDF